MENEIDLIEFFNKIWSKKIQIFIIVILFIIMGIFYTMFAVKPMYISSTTLAFTTAEAIDESPWSTNQRMLATYSTHIKSDSVLKKVISNLKLDINEENLRNNVSINLLAGAQLFEISVISDNPENAKEYADEITKVFIEEVQPLYNIYNAKVINEAKISDKPYNVNHTKNIIIFTFIGIIVAVAYVLIKNSRM